MDESGGFSERYLTVAEANRLNYARQAENYLKHASCVTEDADQALLVNDLKRALRTLGDLGRPPVALDACGGAGNAAMKLQELGCETHLVDICTKLVEIFRRDCRRAGYSPSAEVGEIGSYLTDTSKKFDIIVFCSALHHLEDPVLVLRLAQSTLSPRGLIVTVFDPIRPPRWLRVLREPLRILDRAIKQPTLVLHRSIPVLRRLLRGGSGKRKQTLEITKDNVGTLAEFHGGTGFDDTALAESLERTAGLRILNHDRYIGGCGKVEAFLLKLMRRPNGFKLLLQNKTT